MPLSTFDIVTINAKKIFAIVLIINFNSHVCLKMIGEKFSLGEFAFFFSMINVCNLLVEKMEAGTRESR